MITLILAWTSGGNTRSGCGGAWSGQTLFGLGPEYLLSAGSDFYDIAPDDRQAALFAIGRPAIPPPITATLALIMDIFSPSLATSCLPIGVPGLGDRP